jgi:hypothetical protein
MGNPLNLPFMKKAQEPKTEAQGKAAPSPSEDELRIKLFRMIIERYRDEIEAHESKSISDMKDLAKPHDATVIAIRDSILGSFRPYVYGEHFLAAAKMCFSHLSSFQTISPPVSFWLTFGEMKELMAGDEIDKSILLCSLFRSIGSENAKVFVTSTKNSYVAFEFSGKHYLADHSKPELSEFSGWQECLSAMNGKLLYSFNDTEYENFQETD